MRVEEELFLRLVPITDRLIKYGFSLDKGIYSYEKNIMNNEFKAEILIKKGKVYGKVIDLFSEDEYILIHQNHPGVYALKVREAYIKLLDDIAFHCFKKTHFIFNQSREIEEYIKDKYHREPDFLWDDDKNAVFRHEDHKWFGIIMSVDYSKFIQKTGLCEVLNIKINPLDKDELLKAGLYEAYHMNKKSWISIILDGSISNQLIYQLIDQSYRLTDSHREEIKEWIIPANSSFFDIEEYLDAHKRAVWKQSKGIQKGDILYIYLSAPYSCIMYQCLVIEDHVENALESHHMGIYIDIIKKYKKGDYSFSFIKNYGVKAVRGPRSMPKILSEIINKQKI